MCKDMARSGVGLGLAGISMFVCNLNQTAPGFVHVQTALVLPSIYPTVRQDKFPLCQTALGPLSASHFRLYNTSIPSTSLASHHTAVLFT